MLLNAAAQLLLKAATRTAVNWSPIAARFPGAPPLQLLGAVPLWVGILLRDRLIVWLGALSRVPVSMAYPMLSIGYMVNAFAAALLFGEALSVGKLVGIGLICAGVFMLARMQHS